MAKLVEMNKDEFIQKEKAKFVEKVGKGETVTDVLIDDLSTQEALDNFVRGIIPESFAKDYKKLEKLKSELEKTEKTIKEQLIKMFEEHPEMDGKTVSMDGLKFTYTKPYERLSVDSKKLQEEWPDIYKKVIKKSNVKSTIKTSVEW